jgi:hypothetical protein
MAKDHAYDNPSLMPKEWMLAVMHDPHVALSTRVDIAVQLLKLWPEPHHYVPPAITIVIQGLGTDIDEVAQTKVQVHVQADEDHGSGPVSHA